MEINISINDDKTIVNISDCKSEDDTTAECKQLLQEEDNPQKIFIIFNKYLFRYIQDIYYI